MELRLLVESNVSLLIHQCPVSYLIFAPQKLCETLYKAFIEPEFSIHGLATEGLHCSWKAASGASAEVVTAAAEEVPPISQD